MLSAPADGATNLDSPVRFDWNPVSNAAGYLVVIRNKDGAPTALAETTTRTAVTKAVSEGQNEWWVVAFFNGCPPVESKHQFFTVTETNCDDVRPDPLRARRRRHGPRLAGALRMVARQERHRVQSVGGGR